MRSHPTTRRALLAFAGAILTMASTLGTATADTADTTATTADTAAIEPQALASGQLTVQKIVSGLSSPIGVVNAGDGTGRLFVVERGGKVRIVTGKTLSSNNFLNIGSRIVSGGEQGLLGLAFHPDFATNRHVFVYYTRASDGDIVVARLTANAAGTSAPLSSEQILLTIDHSTYSNHNGGSMAFGPDGYLYIGTGDGGDGGDPFENGQDTAELLGKILRLDVDGTGAGPNAMYAIPGDNPFVGQTGDDEIWAYGLRNPWRISFDSANGNLWIADVGQSRREEVNREPADSVGGRNYGWDVMEGSLCYEPSSGCDTSGKILPTAEYSHALGCSITGGYVYRGTTQRDLQGLYLFGDYCTGRIWTMSATGTSITQRRDTAYNISSFGESESGEVYLLDISGTLYRVIAPEFSDIASSTFIDDIHWLLYEGITGGCGGTKFCPKATVSRVQMAQFLDRVLGLPNTEINHFGDDNGITGEASINRLATSGITGGCAPNSFCPTASVTREQMAIFLDRALDLPATTRNFFSDDTGRTGEAAINRLAAAGLTGGCGGGKYCPTASVTREQMAAFLRRAFQA